MPPSSSSRWLVWWPTQLVRGSGAGVGLRFGTGGAGEVGFEFGVGFGNALDVLHGFEIGRDAAAVFVHGVRAGVVGGEGEGEIVFVFLEEAAQVARAAFDILFRV